MADRPIIFSAPMVRALLSGRKTQTRRIPRLLKGCWIEDGQIWAMTPDGPDTLPLPYAPGDRLYVREAWRAERALDGQNATEIAEACLDAGYSRIWAPIFYEADARMVNFENGMVAGRYRHARFMPRWASRLTLTVTEVRVQRLQDISEADARAEGIIWSEPTAEDREWAKAYAEENGGSDEIKGVWLAPGTRQGYGATKEQRDQMQWGPTAAFAFSCLWNSLHGPDAWDANPWVVALTFTVQRGNIDQIGATA
jgi:hypothetical protein